MARSLVYRYDVDASKVVILSPYREQRSKISESLKKVYRCKDIPVTTIVKSQGKFTFLCFLCILLTSAFNWKSQVSQLMLHIISAAHPIYNVCRGFQSVSSISFFHFFVVYCCFGCCCYCYCCRCCYRNCCCRCFCFCNVISSSPDSDLGGASETC